MSNFNPPIDPSSLPSNQWNAVPATEQTGAIRDPSREKVIEKEPAEKLRIAFLLFLKSRLRLLGSQSPKSKEGTGRISSDNDLLEFKGKIETLLAEDVSFDPLFIWQLAFIWTSLDEKIPLESQTRALLQTIGSFPKGATYTLGFYLSACSNSTWLPFPLISLLQSIYTTPSYRQEAKSWIDQIDKILSATEEST